MKRQASLHYCSRLLSITFRYLRVIALGKLTLGRTEMLWFQKICVIFALLLVGSQRISGLEDADNDGDVVERGGLSEQKLQKVLRVLQNLPLFYGKAVQLWKMFEQVHDALATTPRFEKIDTDARLDALDAKVDKLAADVQAFKERLFQNLKDNNDRKSVEDKLGIITLKMEIINKNFYARFLEYTNPNKTGQEWYILKWVNGVLDDNNAGLAEPLITIKTSLLAGLVDFGSSYNNILDLLAAPNLVNELMCIRQKSAQQSIHGLYKHIILTEIRSYLMTLFSIEVANEVYNQKRDVEIIKKEFEARMNEIYRHVKVALTRASREVWRCDRHFVEGYTYSKLRPIFQKYVLHEGDANKKVINWIQAMNSAMVKGCEKSCPEVSGSSIQECKHEMCSHDESKKCTGILRDCEFQNSEMTVCSSEESSYRRYEYIKAGDDTFYGLKNNCSRDEITGSTVWFGIGASVCDYCLCTCDSSQDEKFDVFIDTRPVESDISQNKAVTGIRIVNGDTIHFEITEGELLPNGYINASTLNTIEPPSRDRSSSESEADASDFFRISWDRRTICLDDLEALEKDAVLTGIKFRVTEDNTIELAIRLTSFDFYTGKLMEENCLWKSYGDFPNSPKRSELSMQHLDMPRGKDANEPRSRPGQCFEFQTTGLEQDAGQTVVPFIDIQSVTTNPPTALSGAGLFVRGSDTTGGFLTPKLFTLNFDQHMPQPNVDYTEE